MKKNFKKITAALGAVAFGVAATATVANADTLYTVQSGDTLSSISQKFANDNSLVQTLAQQNNIQDINKIYVGQQLVVKTDGQATDVQTTAQPAAQATTQSAAAQTSQTTSNYTSTAYGSEADAKAWIAMVNTSVSTNWARPTWMATIHLPTKNALLISMLLVVTVLGRMLSSTGWAMAGTKIRL